MSEMVMKSQWAGNKWPSVDLPTYVHSVAFLEKTLAHLCAAFGVAPPKIDLGWDEYGARFEIAGSKAIANLDHATCSVAFESEHVRDRAFDVLSKLDPSFFESDEARP